MWSAFTYSVHQKEADYHVGEHVTSVDWVTTLPYVLPIWLFPEITLQIPGMLNVENALAAIAVAHQMGIAPESIALALSRLQGGRTPL